MSICKFIITYVAFRICTEGLWKVLYNINEVNGDIHCILHMNRVHSNTCNGVFYLEQY